jgi:hypothetical protein
MACNRDIFTYLYMDRLGNQMYPKIQKLFPNNNAVFLNNNVPIHTAGTVQLWAEEGELQPLPWPAQSSNLNTTEPLWLVLETRMSNRFPPPTTIKQL